MDRGSFAHDCVGGRLRVTGSAERGKFEGIVFDTACRGRTVSPHLLLHGVNVGAVNYVMVVHDPKCLPNPNPACEFRLTGSVHSWYRADRYLAQESCEVCKLAVLLVEVQLTDDRSCCD